LHECYVFLLGFSVALRVELPDLDGVDLESRVVSVWIVPGVVPGSLVVVEGVD